MRKSKTKTAIIPFAFFGSMIENDYIISRFKKKIKLEQVETFVKDLLAKSKSDLFLINANKLIINNHAKAIFLGHGLAEMPDHVSKKRFCIDIRNELIRCGIISDDANPETVGLLIDLYEIEST